MVETMLAHARPRWSLMFPVASVGALMIGVIADLRLFGFTGAVFADHDKLLHFALYGACGFLAVGWFRRHRAARVLAVVGAIVVLEELSQGWFHHRSVDAMDAVASLAGIVVCGALGSWLRDRPARERVAAQ